MRVFAAIDELAAAVGEELGTSAWHTVSQAQVDSFAHATGDHQWIHVDPQRAAGGPFGTTIAHGFLTLSLIPCLAHEVYEVCGARLAINYGLDRVRFPAPLPVGSRIRAAVTIVSVAPVDGGVQVVTRVEVAASASERPCCVAEMITRYVV